MQVFTVRIIYKNKNDIHFYLHYLVKTVQKTTNSFFFFPPDFFFVIDTFKHDARFTVSAITIVSNFFRTRQSKYGKTFIVLPNLKEQRRRREINPASSNNFLYFCRCCFDCNRMPHQSIETTDEDSVKLVDFLDAGFISCFCENNTAYVRELFVNTTNK